MKLSYSPDIAPYVRKLMVLLHETGQLEDLTLEDITTTAACKADAALLRNNPLRQSAPPPGGATKGPAL